MKAATKEKGDTIVSFILDKSGSMSTVQEATISGFNKYIQTLKKDTEGSYKFTLTLFDTEIETPYLSKPLSAVRKLDEESYSPSGNTALYDAVCATIKKLEKNVEKGDKVLVAIMTDGQENSSQEYTQRELHDLITKLQKKDNWSFVFLGANQDSWANAQQWGFNRNNVVNFKSNDAGMDMAFTVMASNTRNFSAMSASATSDFFSKEDSEALDGSGSFTAGGTADMSVTGGDLTASSLDTSASVISAHFSELGKMGGNATASKGADHMRSIGMKGLKSRYKK